MTQWSRTLKAQSWGPEFTPHYPWNKLSAWQAPLILAQRDPKPLSGLHIFSHVYMPTYVYLYTHPHPHKSLKTREINSCSSSSCYLCDRKEDILKKHCVHPSVYQTSETDHHHHGISLGTPCWEEKKPAVT